MQRSRDQLIDALIATYRELNTRVRPLGEERLAAASGGGESVRSIVARMRGDELRFAQALKERITGVPLTASDDEAPVIGTESPDDPTVVLISQFGTARATTLTMLKGLSDEEWNATLDDGKSIQDHVSELVANDQRQLQRIMQLLGTT